MTPDRLAELTGIQDQILDTAAVLTAPQGVLAYATCSLFREENEARVEAFLTRHPAWKIARMDRYDVTPDGDGFFSAQLTRD